MQAFDFEELSIHLDVSDQGFCEATAGKPQESTSATSLINFFQVFFFLALHKPLLHSMLFASIMAWQVPQEYSIHRPSIK